MSMHMSAIYAYEKECFLAEPVMAGLEEAVSGSEVNPDCLLWGGGSLVCSCPCVSGLIPRCQSYSAPKLVRKGGYMRVAERPLVVGPRVPDRNLVNPTVSP